MYYVTYVRGEYRKEEYLNIDNDPYARRRYDYLSSLFSYGHIRDLYKEKLV